MRPARRADGVILALECARRKPAESVDDAPAAHARADPDAGVVRMPPSIGDDALSLAAPRSPARDVVLADAILTPDIGAVATALSGFQQWTGRQRQRQRQRPGHPLEAGP